MCALFLSFTLSSDSSARDVTWEQTPWFEQDFSSVSGTSHVCWNPICVNTCIGSPRLTHYMNEISWGLLEKGPSVLTAQWPLGKGSFCDIQFQAQCSYGTIGPWEVQRETDHSWKTVGIWGDHGGTEQINPGDYCQTACSSGSGDGENGGGGLSWTWVQPPVKEGDAQCSVGLFLGKVNDLSFHFMWWLCAVICNSKFPPNEWERLIHVHDEFPSGKQSGKENSGLKSWNVWMCACAFVHVFQTRVKTALIWNK